ncbi:hypothetical protein [Bradyrhizobium canariense]|uniref:hypothetical protein n=1 Tax=Bradyrhizobium canariense TaxID=255045 RepID=UPI00195878E3|nr:hypothetical protein [Bradyrhizobium canariense]
MQDYSGQQQILDRNLMMNDLTLTPHNVSAGDAQSMKRNPPYFWLRAMIASRPRDLVEYVHDSVQPIVSHARNA